MTTETSVGTTPIVNSDNPPAPVASPVVAVEPPVATTVTEPTTTDVTPPAPAEGGDAGKSVPEWFQKRINEVTGKRYEAERVATEERDRRVAAESRAEELLAQISKTSSTPTSTTPPVTQPPVTEDEINRRAEIRATDIANARRFNDACNRVVESGKKEFKDFDDTLKNLALVGVIGEKANIDFLETAVELKDPHKILHHLGSNMDEAARIAALPPKKMALEMARIEATLNAPKVVPPTPISNAPPPVIPVGGAAVAPQLNIDDPNLSMDQWAKLRAQQVEEKRNRYRRA